MAEGQPNLRDAFKRALAVHRTGDLGEAERLYRAILARKPDHGDALYLLGLIAHRRGNGAAALELIDRAIAAGTTRAEVYGNRGLVLLSLQRFAAALASYERALALQPTQAEFHFNQGNVLLALQRFEEALASYQRALALQPDHAEALSNQGLVLHLLQRFEAALASHDKALALRPDFANAYNNRGNTLHALRRFEDALASYREAARLQPENSEALANLAVAQAQQGDLAAAVASYDAILARWPNQAETLSRRGLALNEMRRFDAALESYACAQATAPDLAEAHWSEGLCHLLRGDLARGWPKFEWRWRLTEFVTVLRNFSAPPWLGKEDLAGKTILLHAEQGFGDTIQFCRYVPLVAATGASIILEVQPGLIPLLQGFAPPAQIKAWEREPPEVDFHCSLLSLPLAFGTRLETIPASIPYLHATRDKIEAMAAQLPQAAFRVGLVWSGNPNHFNDHNRSIALERLDPLFALPGISYVSLQRDVRPEDAVFLSRRPAITSLADRFGDFADTAAAVAALDLVIAVDTSVAHLAGALGKPVWILLPHFPDWRWLLDREDSPWYPSARLFRQPARGDWDAVIARVKVELSRLAAMSKGAYAVGTRLDRHPAVPHRSPS